MRLAVMIFLLVALTVGCQSREEREQQLNMKTLHKTVGPQQLVYTLEKTEPPAMDKRILEQTDENIIGWLKQIDDWTHKVLSSPVTGEMDAAAMEQMNLYLQHIYTPEAAQQMIDYFYRPDPTTGTYQAVSTEAMLGLRSEWANYELSKEEPAQGQILLRLKGSSKTAELATPSEMHHESLYVLDGDRLVIKQFTTHS